MHGLMRVRGFTQDDAHVFCTEQQLADECLKINDLILSTYSDFGFEGDGLNRDKSNYTDTEVAE